MPNCFHLEERLDPPGVLAREVVVPVLDVPDRDALEILGGALAQRRGLIGAQPCGVDRVDLAVTGEVGRQLVAEAGQDVDDASGQVARRERLGEHARRDGARLAREHDAARPARDHGEREGNQPEQAGLVRADHAYDADGLGDSEVVVRPGDGVGAAQDLWVFVAPACEVDDAIDRSGDLFVSVR